MTSAVCDSGPLTHLWQIDLWSVFSTLRVIHIPESVADEVAGHVVLDDFYKIVGIKPIYPTVSPSAIAAVRRQFPAETQLLQDSDIAVFQLARQIAPDVVLTDDLSLRRSIETIGHVPMGTVGLLLRAYRANLLDEASLRRAVDSLFVHTTLYVSPRFKSYVFRLIDDALRETDL